MPFMGDLDARNTLFEFVERLRYDLSIGFNDSNSSCQRDHTIDGITSLHSRMMELSYLSYCPGVFTEGISIPLHPIVDANEL